MERINELIQAWKIEPVADNVKALHAYTLNMHPLEVVDIILNEEGTHNLAGDFVLLAFSEATAKILKDLTDGKQIEGDPNTCYDLMERILSNGGLHVYKRNHDVIANYIRNNECPIVPLSVQGNDELYATLQSLMHKTAELDLYSNQSTKDLVLSLEAASDDFLEVFIIKHASSLTAKDIAELYINSVITYFYSYDGDVSKEENLNLISNYFAPDALTA